MTKRPRNHIQLHGGTISKGPDKGRPIFFLSLWDEGGECIIWESHNYWKAVKELKQCALENGLPAINEFEGTPWAR